MRALILALGFALSAFLFGGRAQAQHAIAPEQNKLPFSTSSSEWEGYSEFVRLAQRKLGSARVKLTAQLDYRELKVGDAVVIVHPLAPLDESSLSAFLADGGRVALLDDFGKGGGLLQKFDIHRISPPANPKDRLRDNPDLAIAVPSVQVVAGAERGRHPIARNVEQVVTNHPLVLRHPNLTPVLEIHDANGSAEALAVTGVIAGKGRLYAQGDPSVFINLMLRYPGNRNLAEGLVDYLAEPRSELNLPGAVGGSPAPSGNIWILANRFEEVGHYGEDESLLEQLRRKMEEAAEAVAAMEHEGMPPMMATFIAALLALWAVSSQMKGNVHLPHLSGQSFARAPVLAAQTGLGARADILSSRKANPILALLELDAALRESSARKLGVNPVGSVGELKRAFARSGLGDADAASLADLLTDLRNVGQSLGHGKPKRVPESSMNNYHQESMRLLDAMEQVGRRA